MQTPVHTSVEVINSDHQQKTVSAHWPTHLIFIVWKLWYLHVASAFPRCAELLFTAVCQIQECTGDVEYMAVPVARYFRVVLGGTCSKWFQRMKHIKATTLSIGLVLVTLITWSCRFLVLVSSGNNAGKVPEFHRQHSCNSNSSMILDQFNTWPDLGRGRQSWQSSHVGSHPPPTQSISQSSIVNQLKITSLWNPSTVQKICISNPINDDPCHSSKVLLSSLVHALSAVSSSLPNGALADVETKPVPSGDSFNQLLSICFYVLDLESQTAYTLSSFSALPFRVACAFCESVLDPAAYPRWEQRLYTFVCICVSVCEVLKAQSCSIMFHCLRKTRLTLGGSRLSLEDDMKWQAR